METEAQQESLWEIATGWFWVIAAILAGLADD